MPRILPLEEALLNGFEFPVALVVEVTKKGIVLSKLRYLKNLGQVVNETIRCPCIEAYVHMDRYCDPYLSERGGGRPMGIDWLFQFGLDNRLYNEVLEQVRRGQLHLNTNNPQVGVMVKRLIERIERKGYISFKKLDPLEQGLLIEPYCSLVFQRAGEGKRTVLQNVEIINTEPSLRARSPGMDIIYTPEPAPHMEIDLLVISEISTVRSILDGLKDYGFTHDRDLS